MLKPIFNKVLFIAGISSAVFMFNSCDDVKDPEPEEIVIDDDYYEFQDFNMSDYDINAILSLPDETANIGASTRPEVIHVEDDIKWEILVGPNFQLLIEDFADISDLIKVEKKELANHDFFKVKYIIDEEDLILYERILIADGTENAAPTVGVEHRTYHVFGQKTIDGITYALESRDEGYEKVIIEIMAKSIKSFKGIESK